MLERLNSGTMQVAPARERGLKLKHQRKPVELRRRSREGAWIEIDETLELMMLPRSLPRGSVD